jgi:hypothetical protein
VKCTQDVLPCALMSTFPAPVYKNRSRVYMQLVYTDVRVGCSLFAWLVLIYMLTHISIMNVYTILFTQQTYWDTAPTPWILWNHSRSLDVGLIGESADSCIIGLEFCSLDLCWFVLYLEHCLYVWSVVIRIHDMLPFTSVSTFPAHAVKYPFSTHMVSFCTWVHVAAYLFAWRAH